MFRKFSFSAMCFVEAAAIIGVNKIICSKDSRDISLKTHVLCFCFSTKILNRVEFLVCAFNMVSLNISILFGHTSGVRCKGNVYVSVQLLDIVLIM